MREVTLRLEDDDLYSAVEAEATEAGLSVQDVVVRVLKEWLVDLEMDEREIPRIEAARREYEKKGGVGAREFFD